MSISQTDQEQPKKKKQRLTGKSMKSFLELWFDKYWNQHLQKHTNNIKKTDKEVHKLIHFLISLGDGMREGEGGPKKNYTKRELLLHQEQINAVMMTIKPGLFTIFTKGYTKKMLFDYLFNLKRNINIEMYL
jgi:hypothetical protein